VEHREKENAYLVSELECDLIQAEGLSKVEGKEADKELPFD